MGVLKDDSVNHQTGASAVGLAKSDPLTAGSSDHFDSVAQKRLSPGAELRLALNLIPAHTWYAAQDHPLRFGIPRVRTGSRAITLRLRLVTLPPSL
jgi:hypothetical protein